MLKYKASIKASAGIGGQSFGCSRQAFQTSAGSYRSR